MRSGNPSGRDDAGESKTLSDLDVMRLYDGDLEDEGLDPAALADPLLPSKLDALDVVGQLVREGAVRRADAADGIADMVMARIAAAEANGTASAAGGEAPPVRARGIRAEIAPPSAPSNDNGAARRIYALAVASVAVAAGLMIWGKMDPPDPTSLRRSADEAARVAAVGPGDEAVRPPPAAGDDAPEGDGDVGVQVAAVDFGARRGSIFFVPSQGRTTTVIWLADELVGEE